jgi:ribosome maturation factor RimP
MLEQEKKAELLAREILAKEPVRVVGIQARAARNGLKLMLVLDTDSGISIDECAHYNRLVRDTLAPQFPDISVEVSSPGVDRLLKTEQDFQRLIGMPVRVRYLSRDAGERDAKGAVRQVAAGVLHMTTHAGQEIAVPLDDIVAAKQEIRWTHGK